MPDRETQAQAFLHSIGWQDVPVAPLAGDASARRYFRLACGADRAVLMDADPARGENVVPFLTVAAHLDRAGLRPPRILGQDAARGFLLLEDLGDGLFARVVARDMGLEAPLYRAAVDVLIALHRLAPPQDLPRYTLPDMADKAALAGQWYAGDPHSAEQLRQASAAVLDPLADLAPSLALRDYHAENLLWLPQEQGHHRVGLLDFQDAMAAPPGYDLVSLLWDARRDVSPALLPDLQARFAAGTGLPGPLLQDCLHRLLAQRSLRIIGVFARLSLHYGKASYVDLIPRVWSHLTEALAHPGLSALKDCVAETLPPPTEAILKDLKNRCATIPTL